MKYKIHQVQANIPGTIINNKAAIYFDTNVPIITDNIFLTIELKENIFLTAIQNVFKTSIQYEVNVWPNPFSNEGYFHVNNVQGLSHLKLSYMMYREMKYFAQMKRVRVISA